MPSLVFSFSRVKPCGVDTNFPHQVMGCFRPHVYRGGGKKARERERDMERKRRGEKVNGEREREKE